MTFASILNAIFSPTFGILFHLTDNYQLNVMLGIMLCAIIISAIILVITKKMVDQEKMKEHKKKIKKYQERIKEARAKNDVKALEKINREMMEVQKKMMGMTMKPMIYTFLPIILIFNWLRYYDYLSTFIATKGYLAALPFALPYFGKTIGWFEWYILCSLPSSSVLKILMKIET